MKILFNKLISILLAFLLITFPTLIISSDPAWAWGCDDVNEQLRQTQAILAQTQSKLKRTQGELQTTIIETHKEIDSLQKNLFEFATLSNTIKGYEIFLREKVNSNLRSQAVSAIYNLTRQADLIEGYAYFLDHFPNSRNVTDASDRVIEIAYEFVKRQNTIPAYYKFLNNFKFAAPELRSDALNRGIALQCQAAKSEFKESASVFENENEAVRQLVNKQLIENIAVRLYREVLDAKKQGNHLSFAQSYNTLHDCDLFNVTTTRLSLDRDEDLRTSLRTSFQEMTNAIKELRHDVKSLSRSTLAELHKVLSIESAQNQCNQKLILLVEKQSQRLADTRKPYGWDDSISAWKNYTKLGIEVLDVVTNTTSLIAFITTLL